MSRWRSRGTSRGPTRARAPRSARRGPERAFRPADPPPRPLRPPPSPAPVLNPRGTLHRAPGNFKRTGSRAALAINRAEDTTRTRLRMRQLTNDVSSPRNAVSQVRPGLLSHRGAQTAVCDRTPRSDRHGVIRLVPRGASSNARTSTIHCRRSLSGVTRASATACLRRHDATIATRTRRSPGYRDSCGSRRNAPTTEICGRRSWAP